MPAYHRSNIQRGTVAQSYRSDHDIPIVEHLRGMELLPADGFHFTAAPPMVGGMGTVPVRAFARLG